MSQAEALGDRVSPPYPLSTPLNLSADDDSRALLRAAWDVSSETDGVGLPVDPFVIAQKLGIKAYAANLDNRVSGMILKRPGEDPEIYVHESDSPNRRRFTCAHELGHYIRRTATEDSEWGHIEPRDLFAWQGNSADEIYANQFAAALLMPEEVVRARFAKLTAPALGAALSLSIEFGVSADAMQFQLKNLRLV